MRSADFFALPAGPHPRRDLSLMPRGRPRGMAAGRSCKYRSVEARQLILNLRAIRFQPRRKDERFAEVRWILVDGESRSFVAISKSTPPGSLKYTDLNQKRSR
jgi:hypothetical protein